MNWAKWFYHNFWFKFHYLELMDKRKIERNYYRMMYHHEKLLVLENRRANNG